MKDRRTPHQKIRDGDPPFTENEDLAYGAIWAAILGTGVVLLCVHHHYWLAAPLAVFTLFVFLGAIVGDEDDHDDGLPAAKTQRTAAEVNDGE